MIVPLLLIILAAIQAAVRSACLPLTLVHAAFFSLSIPAASLDFSHSLLINSAFCLFLAQFCSKKYECLLSGVYVGLQFMAALTYFCMAVAFLYLTEFYTPAINLYNALNDILIILNVAVLIGMTNGGGGVRNRFA